MNKKSDWKVNRRSFLKGSLVVGGAAVLTPSLANERGRHKSAPWYDSPHGIGQDFEEYEATDVIYTLCEQCNTHCTAKVVIKEQEGVVASPGVVRKIAGNPYSPLNSQPFDQIPYETSPVEAAKGKDEMATEGRAFRGGRTCLKGQAGIQTAYDALRVTKPLKRVGPRGSGEFRSISWEQAIKEILEGSDLGTPGLKELNKFVPQGPVMADWDLVKAGEMSQAEFDQKYGDVLIDTKHPDLGPKVNQITSLVGDRRDFIQERFWFKSLGSINTIHHGGICGMPGVMGNTQSFSVGSQKKRMYSDIDHAEYLIIWGTDPFVANKGPSWLAPKLTNALERGMKLVVVDPRMSPAAEKAHKWVPVIPGTDAALALAMARWIIEHKRYDERYLLNPNKAAAQADNEPTWSDATHLVNLSDPKRPKLKASVLGIGENQNVVLQNGVPVIADEAAEGTLEVDTTINGIRVKSAFTLFKERCFERTLAEYAEICGIPVEDIVSLAKEFTSYGKKASITSYRGPAMHTNGFYAIRAIACLNHLLGNYDWKGGAISSGAQYGPLAGLYDLMGVPGERKAWGVTMFRRGPYEKSSLFQKDGYPAKRPWFPIGNHALFEVLPSVGEGYPYPIKALFIHRIAPTLSIGDGERVLEILKDTKKVPLLVVSDLVVSEAASVADYILPDLSYLERWGFETIYPNQPLKLSHFQQPATRAFDGPRAFEDVLIEIGKALKLPGVGDNAFPDGSALHCTEDFYLKLVANIAYNGEPVPDAGSEELQLFSRTRQKALGRYFEEDKWKKAVRPNEWPKVVYVLNRGGRFEAPGSEYVGDHIKYQYGGQADFYSERVAQHRHSYTGEFYDGLPRYEPQRLFNGEEIRDDAYPLHMINWKAHYIGSHRNIHSSWLREIERENFLWINPRDAQARGLKEGDRVMIKSATSQVTGTVKVTERIRPGVVGSNYNYGHFAYGSMPVKIDGKPMAVDPVYGHVEWAQKPNSGYAGPRNAGFAANAVVRHDDSLNVGALFDPVGAGAAQLSTKVEVVKL